MMSLRSVPLTVRLLGFSGLIPFAAPTLLSHMDEGHISTISNVHPMVGEAISYLRPFDVSQRAYGACILSFMGAVHWGIEMAQKSSPMRYVVSVVPSLIGWASLQSDSVRKGVLMQVVSFNALLAYDLLQWRRGRVAGWYPGLRVYLTSGVTVSMLALKQPSNKS